MRNWYNHRPDPVKDRKSVDDFLAWRFPELTHLNDCRAQFAQAQSELAELDRHGLMQGRTSLQRDLVMLAHEIDRLETLLGVRPEMVE
jgi:hypothetical protein